MSSLVSTTFRLPSDTGRTVTVYLDSYENICFSLDGGVTKYPAVNSGSVPGLVVRVDALETRMTTAEGDIVGATNSIAGLTARVGALELSGGTVDTRLGVVENEVVELQ